MSDKKLVISLFVIFVGIIGVGSWLLFQGESSSGQAIAGKSTSIAIIFDQIIYKTSFNGYGFDPKTGLQDIQKGQYLSTSSPFPSSYTIRETFSLDKKEKSAYGWIVSKVSAEKLPADIRSKYLKPIYRFSSVKTAQQINANTDFLYSTDSKLISGFYPPAELLGYIGSEELKKLSSSDQFTQLFGGTHKDSKKHHYIFDKQTVFQQQNLIKRDYPNFASVGYFGTRPNTVITISLPVVPGSVGFQQPSCSAGIVNTVKIPISYQEGKSYDDTTVNLQFIAQGDVSALIKQIPVFTPSPNLNNVKVQSTVSKPVALSSTGASFSILFSAPPAGVPSGIIGYLSIPFIAKKDLTITISQAIASKNVESSKTVLTFDKRVITVKNNGAVCTAS